MSIRYLLKFGKRKNIQGIVGGEVWMSTAECLRPLEDKLVKGQGDKLEGGMHITAKAVKFTDNRSGVTNTLLGGDYSFDILIEPVKAVPIYCLFACFDKDVDEYGNIILSKETKNLIYKHFPEADAVAVITDPKRFVYEFSNSIHNQESLTPLVCKYDLVHYFKMYGIKVVNADGTQTVANDFEYLKFMTQDHEPIKTEKGLCFPVYEDDAWRALFCKDVFFEGEQEYRFILPEETVKTGKQFKVNLTENIKIYDLESFFKDEIK